MESGKSEEERQNDLTDVGQKEHGSEPERAKEKIERSGNERSKGVDCTIELDNT